ncbi:MAG: VCBS repeat-containing protein [Ignavibacteriales bacterium]|nr:VCBS repeat-containing protein [Ignavibacteriales bacterium]
MKKNLILFIALTVLTPLFTSAQTVLPSTGVFGNRQNFLSASVVNNYSTTNAGAITFLSGNFDSEPDIELVDARISTLAVHKKNTSGMYEITTTLDISSWGDNANFRSIAAGDFNRDTHLDIAGIVSGTVHILFNDPANGFSTDIPLPLTNSSGIAEVRAGDVDATNGFDLIVADLKYITLLRNTGTGNFTEELLHTYQFDISNRTLTIGDVDGDGDLDIICNGQNYHEILILRNNGSGIFLESDRLTLTLPYDANFIGVADIGDVNGDEKPDILFTNGFNKKGKSGKDMMLNDASGVFETPTFISIPGFGNDNGRIVDVNGDGFRDIVTMERSLILYIKNNGLNMLTEENKFTLMNGIGGTSHLAIGDLDSDGDPDIASSVAPFGIYTFEQLNILPQITTATKTVGQTGDYPNLMTALSEVNATNRTSELTLLLTDATYTESNFNLVPYYPNQPKITILGQSSTGTKPQITINEIGMFVRNCDDVELNNFAVSHSGPSEGMTAIGNGNGTLLIDNVDVEVSDYSVGIDVYGWSDVTITNCNIHLLIGGIGINVYSDFGELHIDGNTITTDDAADYAIGGGAYEFTDVTISGNTISGPFNQGIYMEGFYVTPPDGKTSMVRNPKPHSPTYDEWKKNVTKRNSITHQKKTPTYKYAEQREKLLKRFQVIREERKIQRNNISPISRKGFTYPLVTISDNVITFSNDYDSESGIGFSEVINANLSIERNSILRTGQEAYTFGAIVIEAVVMDNYIGDELLEVNINDNIINCNAYEGIHLGLMDAPELQFSMNENNIHYWDLGIGIDNYSVANNHTASSGEFDRNTIENYPDGGGQAMYAFNNKMSFSFTNNTINGGGNGVSLGVGNNTLDFDISNNHFDNTMSTGLEFYVNNSSGNIEENTFTGNGENGLMLYFSEGGSVLVQYNSFTNNTGDAIVFDGACKFGGCPPPLANVLLRNNTFDVNGGYNVRNNLTTDIDAQYNWWGVEMTNEINAGGNPKNLVQIYDNYDDDANGVVNYANWLTGTIGTTTLGSISGKVTYDDGDCVPEDGEDGLEGWIVKLEPGEIYRSTRSDGSYSFGLLSAGTYTISVIPKNHWEQVCPAPTTTRTAEIAEGQNSTGNDFGFYVDPSIYDLSVLVTNIVPSRPGFKVPYEIVVKNVGTATTDGSVTLTYPPEANYLAGFNNPAEDNYNPTLKKATWNFYGLEPEAEYRISTTMRFFQPDTVVNGDEVSVCADVTVTGNTDVNTDNNNYCDTRLMVGSYDPNDKTVLPIGEGELGVIKGTELMTYRIRFQNTGTFLAENIVVRDTMDNNLDLSKLQVFGTSHPYTLQINNRVVTWTFQNINLPDSTSDEPNSHGFILFTIRTKPNLIIGTEVKNDASIYFDFNLPIYTNKVRNTVGFDSVEFRTFKADTALSKKVVKLAYKNGVLKQKPNTVTAVEEVFRRLGKSGATFLGVRQINPDSAKRYSWVGFSKGTEIGKLYTAKHDTNRNFPLDSVRDLTTGKGKKALNKLLKPAVKKFNNYFWEQAIAFKLNLIASDTGVTPRGLKNLQLTSDVTIAGRSLKDKSLAYISNYVDTLATYWKSNGITEASDYTELKNIANILKTINEAFFAPLDDANTLVDSLAVVKGTFDTKFKKNPYAVSLLGVKTATDAGILRYVPNLKSEQVNYDNTDVETPNAFALHQNYPNPFNPTTTLSFVIRHSSFVTLKIYNILGQEITTLINDGLLEEGKHLIQWDASRVSSGVYFYRLTAQGVEEDGNFTSLKKMVVVK